MTVTLAVHDAALAIDCHDVKAMFLFLQKLALEFKSAERSGHPSKDLPDWVNADAYFKFYKEEYMPLAGLSLVEEGHLKGKEPEDDSKTKKKRNNKNKNKNRKLRQKAQAEGNGGEVAVALSSNEDKDKCETELERGVENDKGGEKEQVQAHEVKMDSVRADDSEVES